MKKLSLVALMLFSFGIMLTIQSCKDECKDVECQNGGICEEGICDCATGYEGDLCETEERAKFLGTYEVTDDCDTQKYQSSVSSSSSETTKVLISNFANIFISTVSATVDGTSITISKQVPDNDDWAVEGSGSISGSTMTMSYSVTEPDNTVHTCSTTWTKQ